MEEPAVKKARFCVAKAEDDLNVLLDSKNSTNEKATESSVNVVRLYCTERQNDEHFEDFTAEERAITLTFFTVKL